MANFIYTEGPKITLGELDDGMVAEISGDVMGGERSGR